MLLPHKFMTRSCLLLKPASSVRFVAQRVNYNYLLERRFASTILAPSNQKAIGYWLLGCSGMIVGAVVLGGVTRLTESGLSIVDWHLIKGVKPPVGAEDWKCEFDKYKMYPEYEFKSGVKEMTMADFKFIWYMEYLHRMWGRAIGLAFFIPASVFWYKGYFNASLKKRVILMGGLLLFQGLLGWYMVKSGLDPSKNSLNVPRVSQYRLASHLGSAFALYALTLWSGLSLLTKTIDHSNVAGLKRFRILAHSSKGAVFVTAIIGAFVAGLDAGLLHNTWPKYSGRWIPVDVWDSAASWRNFTENPAMVQFLHRNLAYFSLGIISATWFAGRRLMLPRSTNFALNSLVAVAVLQTMLGISTLVHGVPVVLGSLHQFGSLTLLTMAIWLTNTLRRLPVPK